MPNADVGLYRKTWLNLSKDLCEALARREHRYPELCVRFELEADERKEVLTKIATETKEIGRLCQELRETESACPVPLGCRAVFGEAVIPDHIRCALIVMAVSRFSDELASDTKRVCSLVSLCVGRDLEKAAELRDCFQFGGLLRKVALVKLSKVVDCHEVMLRESALDRMLAKEPTSETLALEESQAWDGRRSR